MMAQQQAQNQDQSIQLSKSGKSYFYQGKYYKFGNSQTCENMNDFNKKCMKFVSKQNALDAVITFYRTGNWHNEHIVSSRVKSIKNYIQAVVMFNQNYELLLKVVDMHYSLTSMKQNGKYSLLIPTLVDRTEHCLYFLTNEIDTTPEIVAALKEVNRNKGIREAKIFIEIIKGRVAVNREKMKLLSRFLFARRIDSNVASIIYTYCF